MSEPSRGPQIHHGCRICDIGPVAFVGDVCAECIALIQKGDLEDPTGAIKRKTINDYPFLESTETTEDRLRRLVARSLRPLADEALRKVTRNEVAGKSSQVKVTPLGKDDEELYKIGGS